MEEGYMLFDADGTCYTVLGGKKIVLNDAQTVELLAPAAPVHIPPQPQPVVQRPAAAPKSAPQQPDEDVRVDGSSFELRIIGRVGKDPRYVKNSKGEPIMHFSVCTEHFYGDVKKVDWHQIVAFGKLAKAQMGILGGGSKVVVDCNRGEMQEYTNSQGVRCQSVEYVASRITWCRDTKAPVGDAKSENNAYAPSAPTHSGDGMSI